MSLRTPNVIIEFLKAIRIRSMRITLCIKISTATTRTCILKENLPLYSNIPSSAIQAIHHRKHVLLVILFLHVGIHNKITVPSLLMLQAIYQVNPQTHFCHILNSSKIGRFSNWKIQVINIANCNYENRQLVALVRLIQAFMKICR